MVIEARPAQRTRSGRLWVFAAAIGCLVAGFGAGFLARVEAAASVNAQLVQVRSDLTKQSADAQEKMAALQKDLSDRDTQIASLQETAKKVNDLQVQVTALNRQLGGLQRGGGLERLQELAANLSNDRLLLSEMRKDPPANRNDARTYWTGVKDLAIKSSPALGPMTDRIIASIQAHYNWSERNYSTTDQKDLSYVLTGANVYDNSSKAFWNAFLKVAIDRIDAVSISVR